MTALFLAPLGLEARGLRRGAPGVSVEQIGMGPTKASDATTRLLATESPGRPILLAGLGGGLLAAQRPGDVIVAESLTTVGAADRVDLAGVDEVMTLLEAGGLSPRRGVLVSSPVIVKGDAARAELAAKGAEVVDMEAAWCAPLAKRHPFVVIRVLLDIPGRELFSPRTAIAARCAFRNLSRIARVLATWAPRIEVSLSPEVPKA